MATKLAPSILSADFGRLGEQVKEATSSGADYIHLDVMDGQFVPNITFGPVVLEGIRSFTHLPLDTHLMILNPEDRVDDFINAGADHITIHAEACYHLHKVIDHIKTSGRVAGIAINPTTSVPSIEEVLPYVDLVLVLTVNPGFGGQTMISQALKKVSHLKQIMTEKNYRFEIEVDGGINAQTAASAILAGADVLVVGSAIFNNKESVEDAMNRLRASLI